MKSELFAVTSTVPVFKHRGAEFKDVTIDWFVSDRKKPVVDLRDWIDFEKASDPYYSMNAVNELFTQKEAEQLKKYLLDAHGDDNVQIHPASPVHDDVMPWGAISFGGPRDFVKLTNDDEYSLPFEAEGHFSVEGMTPLRTLTPTPPPNFSLHKATPPWVKPADSTLGAPWKNAPPFNPQAHVDNRLTTLELKLDGIEQWADIVWPCSLGSEAYEASNSVHDLIAEGITGAISHCQESAAALVTVLGTAADNRADAICKRADLLESLLLNVRDLVLNIDERLNALEARTPC